MRNTWKRWLSGFVGMSMLVTSLPSQAFAYMAPEGSAKPVRVVTSEGKTLEVEDTWEAQYPYGIFLFDKAEAHLLEGGDEAVIPIYRLGGTEGRAIAYVNYNPSIMQLDEDRVSYGNAAGCGDVHIEVEDPLPIAQYQPLGVPAQPEPTDVRITVSAYTGEDAEAGDQVLTTDTEADAWQWYARTYQAEDGTSPGATAGGDEEWKAVEGATDKDFIVPQESMEEYDFRCVFTKNGIRYCTDSVRGAAYEKEPEEVLPGLPAGLDLSPAKAFTALEMSPEDPYAGYIFNVTFADGEWVKEIHVRSPEDDEAEAMEVGTFTLIDHLGGDILNEAATLTLSVEDNEAPLPFSIGFEKKEVEADKAEGSARIHIKRTGGTQTMVTVDYATADGTAVAGRDYQTVTGTAAFYAGVDETVIEIPLIDDGTVSDRPVSFRIRLGEVKGDSLGLCTLTQTSADIAVTNSGRGSGSNLATMLTDSEAEDVSGNITIEEGIAAPVEESVITGEPVEIPEEELLTGRIAGFDEGITPEGEDASLDTYSYGEITFGGSHSGSYWGDTASAAGQSRNDITGWSGGSASGSGWEIKSKSPASASLRIPYMNQMYSRFSGSYDFDAKLAGSWTLAFCGLEYVYGWAAVTKNGNVLNPYQAIASCNPRDTSHGTTYQVTYTTTGSIDTSWDIDASVTGLTLGLSRYDAHDADNDVHSRITKGTLTRRSLNNNLRLKIHTANDGESGDGNVATAPDGAARLTEGSGVYESMKPRVTVVPGAGGVTSSGRLYVGSRLNVSLTNLDSYKPLDAYGLNSAVYLTRADGSIVQGPKIERNGRDYYITLVWDNMTAADLTDTYTINVALTRRQKILLDLTPSVPRLPDLTGNASNDYDPARVKEAWAEFKANGGSNITLGYSEASSRAPFFSTTVREMELPVYEIESTDNCPFLDLYAPENVQYINFNRNAGDRIMYCGKIYSGNERIALRTEDLAMGSLRFYYYAESCLDLNSTMTPSVLRTELYFDGDGDGRISGTYNSDTGYFKLSTDTADRFIMMLEDNESYNEVNFQPELLDNGKYGEYFLKIYYTMIPRNLTEPAGHSGDRAQVLPAFTTSITDQTVYSTLTEEQQSYRYILSGVRADGTRTSDNHPMYGAPASAVQFVDVPAGGDHSPVVSQGDEEHGYTHTWTPDFRGHLIYPFSNPEPIYIEHCLAGDNFPLAEVTFDKKNGMQTDGRGKDNLNGYLGSFAGNTTVSLCVTMQQHTADELRADPKTAETLQPESSGLIRRSTTPDAAYLSQMNSGGMGEPSVDPSESGNEYAELVPDYGAKLPVNTYGLLGYASVVTNKNDVILSVSVPVLSKSKTNGDKAKTTRLPDTVKGQTTTQFNELKGWMQSVKDENKFSEALKSKNYVDGAKAGSLKSTKLSASVSAAFVFSWRYDTITNEFCFRELAVAITGTLSFKYTYRFAPCPIVYVYAAINLSLTVTTGGTVARYENERDIPFIKADQTRALKKNADLGFSTKYKNIILQFTGKIYLEVLDQEGGVPVTGTVGGFMKSDGGKKQTIRLSKESGMEFDREYYVHIVALDDSSVSYLNVIESVTTDLVWSGVKFTPKLAIEVGLGAGVDLLKVEGCFKVVVNANIVLGLYDEKTHNRSSEVTSFKAALSLTLRAVLFGASAEIDALGVGISYSNKDGWKSTYTLWGKEKSFDEVSEIFKPLEDCTDSQTIYSPHPADTEEDDLSADAYEPDDPAVPFQLSGFNSSVSAFKLGDGLTLGYDYQVVTVNGENYVVYTYGRSNPAGEMDRPMLVLSRLVSTGGMDSVGLVNPTDDIHPDKDSTRNRIPYIPVDTGADGSDDGTGDLEFSVTADGNLIRVAWVSYAEPGITADSSALLRELSKNTVVKTASFDTTKKNGFTPAQVVSGPVGNRVLLPAVPDQDLTVWVKAEPMTDAERTEASRSYEQGLAAAGYDPHSNDPALADIGKYRLATQEAFWDVNGKRNLLCVNVGGKVTELALPEGQAVDNIEFVRSGERVYAAYTTREVRFTDAEGNGLTGAEGAKNIVTIRRLFLNGFTVQNGAAVWTGDGKSALIRTLYDYENNGALQDGVYAGGAITPYSEPYFANLRFLRATLGNALNGSSEHFTTLMAAPDPEDFLLFEMNGCTYVIRQESLESILTEQTGTVIPFFATDEDLDGRLDQGESSATGRSDVTIGADGEGGLAAVYVSTVPNTTNNALYMTRYDGNTGSWGKGVILAMNHMDVYEDSAAQGWEPEETEQAYLGKRSGYQKGGMDQFTFTSPRIALGVKGEAASGDELSTADGDAGNQTTLLVLTQGNMSYLKDVTAEDGEYLTIDDAGSGKYPKGTGLYAVSYGVGHQTLGEAGLSFVNYDFTAGAELQAALSFKNTGDMSIRGSDDEGQAITVDLSVDGEEVPDTLLQSWSITENIVPGQEVRLEGGFTLPVTLPRGARFNISVSEGGYYEAQGGIPYTATLAGVLTVEEKPELAFEDAAVVLAGLKEGAVKLDADGNAVLDVNFMVGNRGNTDASDVYVQFTHDTGRKDADGNPVYEAFDISKNTLTVSEETELATQDAFSGPGLNYTDGVIKLGSLSKGFGRRVEGEITVKPDSCFVGEGNLLGLHLEIFSSADSAVRWQSDTRVHKAEHGEYNRDNNLLTMQISPAVSFLTKDQLILSKGSLMRLPISYLSTTGSHIPDIQVAEYPDKEDTDGNEQTRFSHMDQNLDRLFYEKVSYDGAGRGEGTVVIRASKVGSGYIRILDQDTNSYQDIPFSVTEDAAGMDIGPENGRFTFYNADGSVWDHEKPGDWIYNTSLEAWGADRKGNFDSAQPYRGTLLRALKDASFSFETEAEAIQLYMDGRVEVTSDFPGFTTGQFISTGGDPQKNAPAFVFLGANPDNKRHRVTIRIVSNGGIHSDTYLSLDRLVERFSGDVTGDITAEPDVAPKLYWGSSFPKKGTYTDYRYTARLNVISSAAISGVTVKGPIIDGKVNIGRMAGSNVPDSCRVVIFNIHGNGTFTVDAVDKNGNHCVQQVDVDWWPEGRTAGAAALDEETPIPDPDEMTTEGQWMTTELVDGPKPFINVAIDRSAPYKDIIIVSGLMDEMTELMDSGREFELEDLLKIHLEFGRRGREYRIPLSKTGTHVVLAFSYPPGALEEDPAGEYSFKITQPDGSVNIYNATDEIYHSMELIHVDELPTVNTAVQVLPDNRLTWDSVSDGDALYLLKGGKYTYEDGLTVTPAVNKAVTLTPRTRRLNVKKNTQLTLKKGDETKTVNLTAVTIKAKTVTLNSRRKAVSCEELFTGAEKLLPDISGDQYRVSVKKDKKGILEPIYAPQPKSIFATLDYFYLFSTGRSGSATVTATFGGKEFTATVKCGGYPSMDDVTGRLVQKLPVTDENGNHVLTYDAVSEGDTLLLLKNGAYALEKGVTLEPAGDAYRNAIKVTENKKTGIRKLVLGKEAPVKLSKLVEVNGEQQTQSKTILVNFVTVKKKTVTLAKAGDTVSLAELFDGAYELLPDLSGGEAYGGYAIEIRDDKSVLSIDADTFPETYGTINPDLSDFILTHAGKRGSATVSATFGGRVFKATVKCK